MSTAWLIGLRVGAVFSKSHISCAVVNGKEVIGTHVVARDPDTDLGPQLLEVLQRIAAAKGLRRLRRRPRVRVALQYPHARFKILADLPPVASASEMHLLVHGSVERFFLRPPSEFLVGISHSQSRGTCAALYDASVVRRVGQAVAAANCTLETVIASEAVAELGQTSNGALTDAERADVVLAQSLALSPEDELLATVSRQHYGVSNVTAIHGNALVMAAAAVITLVGLVGPGLLAMRQAEVMRAQLSDSDSAAASATRLSRQLEQVTAASSQIEQFQRDRRSVLRVLAEVAARVPEGAIVESFQLDSASGSVTIAGEGAADVASLLESAKSIRAVRLAAPVERIAAEIRPAGDAAGKSGVRVVLKYQLTPSQPEPRAATAVLRPFLAPITAAAR